MSEIHPLYRTRVEATDPWRGIRFWLVLGCQCGAREFPDYRDAINHAQRCARGKRESED